MSYKLSKDFPGVPKGEILELDASNPNNLVYRSVNNPKFWVAVEHVDSTKDEAGKEVFEIVKDKQQQADEVRLQIAELETKLAAIEAVEIDPIEEPIGDIK